MKRDKDILTSEKAIKYLQEQLAVTPQASIKGSINSLIEAQLKTRMMANIHEDYALIAIEPPFIPERRYYPVRSLIAIFGTLFVHWHYCCLNKEKRTTLVTNQFFYFKSIEHMSSISKSNKKITIVGAGYVGMSLAVLLSQYKVNVLDIDPDRVLNINSNNSTIGDPEIKETARKPQH